jgi:hypothetical protein
MIRGSWAAAIRPNVAAVFTVVFGLLKFTVLNRLKNSRLFRSYGAINLIIAAR